MVSTAFVVGAALRQEIATSIRVELIKRSNLATGLGSRSPVSSSWMLTDHEEKSHRRQGQGDPHEQPETVHVAEHAGLPVDILLYPSESPFGATRVDK